jgi:hypothetical protein
MTVAIFNEIDSLTKTTRRWESENCSIGTVRIIEVIPSELFSIKIKDHRADGWRSAGVIDGPFEEAIRMAEAMVPWKVPA